MVPRTLAQQLIFSVDNSLIGTWSGLGFRIRARVMGVRIRASVWVRVDFNYTSIGVHTHHLLTSSASVLGFSVVRVRVSCAVSRCW